MIVKIKGTGKSADMPTSYEVDLDKEQAENLVRKGYAVIVEGKTEEPKPEPPKEEIKPITLASVKSEKEEEKPVENDQTDAIAAKEKEFKEALDKETKKKLKKELDDLKKKK